ncbi:MAG: ATP-dependent Clp protease ATP-binding subunit [Burkholderiales bacterium]|nr:ATP-dependent Clp protease ATP-binding subunit [Burkholderiales bacterium]
MSGIANPPRWISDLTRLTPIRAQFVLAGNIRDTFLTPFEGSVTLAPLLRCLWAHLAQLDYRFLLVYDPVDGLRPYPNEPESVELATRLFDLKLTDGAMPMSLENLVGTMRKVATMREARCALVIDFASRLARVPNQLDAAEHRFFVAAERISLAAHPVVPKGADITSTNGKARFNPTLWLVNRAQDLPSWLVLDSTRVAMLNLGLPDYETRLEAARVLGSLFAGYEAGEATAQEKFARDFAQRTDGLPLVALADIAQLADRLGFAFTDVDDAVQCFKVGATENPWKKDYLRARIADALPFIEERVKGQRAAVTKTIDILMRSVMGLTGAQARSSGNRPRGVLFFAGPTGVGKTELAKTLTQLVFGDERAYIRFDMSEFAEEHTGARLLGAPPGYIGYDAGGELTNAVREKPFSVVLFDEIEKAHPRILDKFLQILEDGRLTDGRGETAYFSEAVLVFTSNLGIFVEDEHGRRVQSVAPGDAPEVVESRVRTAIQDYFKFRLSRPEILNRIGDNIVVFGFITPEVGHQIFDGMLRNVANRVREEHKIELVLASAVRDRLRELCTQDLANGGRGIGNRLESLFVNPLARAMFRIPLDGRTQVTVKAMAEDANRIMTVELE